MNIQNALDSLKTNGGFSYNIQTGELNPNKGYMVATSKDTERIFSNYSNFLIGTTRDIIKDYALSYADKLADKNVFLGAWIDDGKLYLDISQRLATKKQAVSACIDREQLAYYDNSRKETIYIATAKVSKPKTQTGKIPNSVGFSRMSGVTHRR